MSYYGKTAHELHDLLMNKSVTAEELTKDAFTRIDTVEDKVKAFTSFAQEQALQKAQAVDDKIAKNEEIGMLAGIPMGIKDNMATNGIPTTCSSKMLANFVPPYDAAVVEKLTAANGVMLGKLNMDEFAMGSSTENSAFFPTKNPWDLDCVPGGSSGGAAACVAADEVVFSLGSDTGGSIRQPAAYCGVVGMKPTYGLVSRFGLIAFASSLDQIGPVTRDVEDCAHVMNEITGHDHRDSTSSEYQAPDYTQFLHQDIKGMKIGLATEYLGQGLAPDVKEVIMKAVEQLTELGAEVEEVSLPHVEYALPAYYIIAPAEASSNLARYDGVRYGFRAEESTDILDMFKRTRSEGFGDEVKMRIMLGTYALSSGYYDAYYLKALKVRTLIKQDFDQAFAKYDVVIGPTAPTGAFKFGAKSQDQLSMYLSDVYTIPINLAGIPALSVPCGFDAQKMPVGLQIIGNVFDEGKLLQVAHAYEQATDFHLAKPNLNGEDK